MTNTLSFFITVFSLMWKILKPILIIGLILMLLIPIIIGFILGRNMLDAFGDGVYNTFSWNNRR